MGCSRNKLASLTLASVVLSCSGGSTSVPENFVHLYGDLRIASKEFGETSTDGKIARVQILERYGFTAQKFDSIAEWIQSTPDAWSPFEESVTAYVDSLAISAGAIAPPKANLPKNGKVAK